MNAWRKRNRGRVRAWHRGYIRRMRELYGGEPASNTEARFKWLMAKQQTKKPRNKRVKGAKKAGRPGRHVDAIALKKTKA